MTSDLRHRGRRKNPFSFLGLPTSRYHHDDNLSIKSKSEDSNNEDKTNSTIAHVTEKRGQQYTSICTEVYKCQHNPPQQHHFSHQQKQRRSMILRKKHFNTNKICVYMITCSIFILLSNSTYSNGYGMVQEDRDDREDEIQLLHDDDNTNIIIKLQIPYLEFGNNDDINPGCKRQFVKPIGDIIYDASDYVNNDELENNDYDNYYYSSEEYEEGETVQNHETSEHDADYDYYDYDSSEENYYESQEQKQENNDYHYKEYEYYDENHSLEEEEDMKSNHYDDYINYADDTLRNYFAFDDDNIRHKQCKRTSWHRHHKPSCNMFHELDLIDVDNPMYYLASGAYRDAFRISLFGTDNGTGEGEHFVLKKGSQKKKYE